ncbi:CDP-archaeol synthase [Methylocella sp.]|uniref:CDP-archaeol synthase n=1 Tax=Methylocella sp. TaxID=1978226 RepID=UPI0037842D79
MNWAAIAQGLTLVFLANGAPLLAARLLGPVGAYPIDFHLKFADGARVLGASKTFRGVGASLVATTLAALAMGLPWHAGALAAAGAMAGDAFSSLSSGASRCSPQAWRLRVDQAPFSGSRCFC